MQRANLQKRQLNTAGFSTVIRARSRFPIRDVQKQEEEQWQRLQISFLETITEYAALRESSPSANLRVS